MPPQAAPSPWVRRFASLVPAGGMVLDLACGGGRHTRLFLDRGHPVTAVDRDLSGLVDAGLRGAAGLEAMEIDLESGAPFPLADRRFAAVVVTKYLHRPLLPALVGTVAEGGLLLYETFARGNEAFRHPRNPAFLLQPGELLDAVRGRLLVVAYEHGRIDDPQPGVVQRIAAMNVYADVAPPPLYPGNGDRHKQQKDM